MTKEEFKKIVKQLEVLSTQNNEYYNFGIDLFDGKYPILDTVYIIIEMLFASIYKTEGLDWINWFLYDCDFGTKTLGVWDNPICRNIDELYDHIEQYKK